MQTQQIIWIRWFVYAQDAMEEAIRVKVNDSPTDHYQIFHSSHRFCANRVVRIPTGFYHEYIKWCMNKTSIYTDNNYIFQTIYTSHYTTLKLFWLRILSQQLIYLLVGQRFCIRNKFPLSFLLLFQALCFLKRKYRNYSLNCCTGHYWQKFHTLSYIKC